MTHIAPGVYTVWSVLSVTLIGFLLSHIWKFDRFECLKWGRGQNAGAFKRVMTFSYLISVPLLIAYSIGMSIVKYREGYMTVPGHGIIPTPYQAWAPENARLILPLQIVFSVAWGLEIVTHLEELCFWLFLITVGPKHTSWFHSTEFKVWAAGSICALAGMPVVTWATRSDPLKCESYTFLAGSIGSFIITVWSIRVLWVFPGFVRRVKDAGGEPEVVVRLTTFNDLNVSRVVFRFFFVIPTLTLAIDGITSHPHVNENSLWTDLLAILAGVGLVVSSAFTLLIFFPRSIEREAGYKPRRKSSGTSATSNQGHSLHHIDDDPIEPSGSNPFGSPHQPAHIQLPSRNTEDDFGYMDDKRAIGGVWEMVTTPPPASTNPYGMAAAMESGTPRFEQGSSTHNLRPVRPPRLSLHPMLMNYSSPINFTEGDSRGIARYPPGKRPRPTNAV